MLGLPEDVTTCLFDLDGVLTDTAAVHAKAWQEMFDDFLGKCTDLAPSATAPFSAADYETYVDGKPRLDGVRDFLASRGIHLPEGDADAGPDSDTVVGLGLRKNRIVLRRLRDDGVPVFDGSRRYLESAAGSGLHRAVVSASENAGEVLSAAGLSPLLELRIDGNTIKEQGLRGKPAPDTYLAAAAGFGAPPSQCAVFEDAVSGVAAGVAGGFGYVVGVDRVHHADQLRAAGAHVVVTDLAELLEAG